MDILESSLAKLVEFIQAASPVVWQTALRQVQAEAISYIALAAVLFLASGMLVWSICRNWRIAHDPNVSSYAQSEAEMWMMAPFIALVFCLPVATILALSAVKMFYNPTWYAIKLLMGMVGG